MREWGGVREMAFDGVLEGRSGGKVRRRERERGREREREREGEGERERFIEIQRERKPEGMYLMDLR